MRRPREAIALPSMAKDAGYLANQDTFTLVTRIYSLGGLEIEFLIAQRGSGSESAVRTNLGVHAIPLTPVQMLGLNQTQVELFGHTINVPLPEAYVLHKVIIHGRRAAKIEKDRTAINGLLAYLNPQVLDSVFDGLTKSEKNTVLRSRLLFPGLLSLLEQ